MKEFNDFMNTAGIIGLVMIIVAIALIIAIFEIKRNTRKTAIRLKEISDKLDRIAPNTNYQQQQTQQYYSQNTGFENNYYR